MLETSLIRWVGRRLEVNDLLLHHSTLTKKSDMSYNQPILAIRSMQTIFSITEIQLQLLTAISLALWRKVKHQNIFFCGVNFEAWKQTKDWQRVLQKTLWKNHEIKGTKYLQLVQNF